MSIEKAIYKRKFDFNSNDIRTVAGFINPSTKNPIKIKKVRVINVHKESHLGNHWREYDEFYGIIGNAEFILEDIKTKKRKIYFMETGDSLYIPKEVALKVIANGGTIIIVCSEELKREEGTHAYDFE
jgi:oxalate decarboxylase/phosphoglucose isomerase-like protein (cupin superfamily)